MIRKKLKGLVAAVLTTAICTGLFVGCGSSSSSTKTDASADKATTGKANVTFKSSKPLTFSMLFNDSPTYPYKQDWMLLKKIKEITNVSFKLTVVPMSDYIQKRSLLISTGDAPEIMPKTYPGQETSFIASGAILPISDYVSEMPNFQKKIKDWNMKDDLKAIMQDNGKYYVLPGLHQTPLQDYSFAMRTDLLEKNNLKVPTTYEELEETLKKIKELYPDMLPWSDRFQFASALNIAAPTFGATYGWNMGNGEMYDKASDKFVFSPTTKEYKNMLTYFGGLVKEKLLDTESFTQSDDKAVQKFVNGKSFMISTNSQYLLSYRQSMDKTLGSGKYKVVKINVPAGPKGALLASSRLENGIMFSKKAAKNPNFHQMLKFVDWLWYSDEGQELSKWGVKGVTYNVQNGKRVLADGINFQGLNPKGGSKDLRQQYGFSGGVFSYGGSDDLMQSMLSDEDKAFQKEIKATKTFIKPDPPVLFSDSEREQATLVGKPLMDYVQSMTFKFMNGTASIDKDWDSYVAQCKTKGSDRLNDMTNKTYKATKSKINAK